jgi:uncharacterized protein (TIGR02757 family)
MNKKNGKSKLKNLLDQMIIDFPPVSKIKDDPVQIPRWYFEQGRCNEEVEAVALLSAMLAYGSAKQFIKKLTLIMEACNWNYLKQITRDTGFDNWPGYRLSTREEIVCLARATGIIFRTRSNLKSIFLSGYSHCQSIKKGLIELRRALLDACIEIIGANNISRGLLHLLPDPDTGGCVKRWNMFLRWMVRTNDGVDMNLWPEVSPSYLIIPLDRHISRISRNLGLTDRKTDDWKTAVEISENLARLDPEDPIKYDFSLCHLGISGKCDHGKSPELCKNCSLSSACAMKLKRKS